jgi:hypothetical protein
VPSTSDLSQGVPCSCVSSTRKNNSQHALGSRATVVCPRAMGCSAGRPSGYKPTRADIFPAGSTGYCLWNINWLVGVAGHCGPAPTPHKEKGGFFISGEFVNGLATMADHWASCPVSRGAGRKRTASEFAEGYRRVSRQGRSQPSQSPSSSPKVEISCREAERLTCQAEGFCDDFTVATDSPHSKVDGA